MAINLTNYVVSDLCLGKPPLKSLTFSSTTTIADALSVLKSTCDNSISVWSCYCNHSTNLSLATSHIISDLNNKSLCKCVGKISMVDIICFLCKEENLGSPNAALLSPITSILDTTSGIVHHVDPSTSLMEAIDLILEGAQNLVVPIQSTTSHSRRNQQKLGPTFYIGSDYCWLTQEDIIQFFLSRIGLLTAISNLSVESLEIIQTEILTVDYHSPAKIALDAISHSLVEQTSVGVVDEDGALVGEISPFTLACCDETVAAAIMTLSCGDLMAFVDWGEPPEDIIRIMKTRLTQQKLQGLLQMLDEEYSSSSSSHGLTSSSSEDESSVSSSPNRKLSQHKSGSYSARMIRKAEAIVCHPRSSLIAVMIQAIAHRVNYVWVMDDNYTPIGIVTFRDMLEVFREHLQSIIEE